MVFLFRFPFDLAETQRIGIAAIEALIADTDGHQILLRSGTELPISQTGRLELRGFGYESAPEAVSDGQRWMGAVAVGLLRVNLAPDLRDRSMPFVMTEDSEEALAEYEETHKGGSVKVDVPGVRAYSAEEVPGRFVRMFTTDLLVRGYEDTQRAIRDAYLAGLQPDAAALVAIDLLSSYYRMPSTDAQFLSLMMALEALIVPIPLDSASVAAVEIAARAIRGTDLPDAVRDSLVGRILALTHESIGRAGRRLALGLRENRYANRDASSFFTYCYGMRSRIVHGNLDRPEPAELHATTAELLRYVYDLLDLRTSIQ